jgi:nucleoside-diphosphate-sugar epimerase
MKVIITGATGFLGRNLAEGFRDDGMEVVATGRSTGAGAQLRSRGIDFRAADIRDPAAVGGAFEPADCVVHCAALAGDWGRHDDFHAANVLGTRHVVEACARHGIAKIIFISTPSIYYTGADRYDISEDDPLPTNQASPYSRTKLIAESELMAKAGRDLDAIVLRPRAVYGPHDRIIVPRIIQLARRRRFPLIGGGRALTDVTDVDNFVDAVRACLRAEPGAWNQVYNISNDEPISMRDWFGQMLDCLGLPFRPREISEPAARAVASVMEAASRLPFGPREPSLTRFSVGYMSRSMTMSIDKARRLLGYTPRIGNREGFERCASWFREQGLV